MSTVKMELQQGRDRKIIMWTNLHLSIQLENLQ